MAVQINREDTSPEVYKVHFQRNEKNKETTWNVFCCFFNLERQNEVAQTEVMNNQDAIQQV